MANSLHYYNTLQDNIAREQAEFLEELKQLPPGEIIDRAYEIASRNEICLILENENFSKEQRRVLSSIQNPVKSFYQEWLSSGDTDNQALRDSMTDFTDGLVKSERTEKQVERKQMHKQRECR